MRKIGYKDCVAILKAYQEQAQPRLRPGGNEIAYRVVPRPHEGPSAFDFERVVLNPAEQLPAGLDFFTVEIEGGDRLEIRPKIVPGRIPIALGDNEGGSPEESMSYLRGGDRLDGARTGTMGWFFYLDGRFVGISNRHVMGSTPGDTITAGPVPADGSIHLALDFSYHADYHNKWDLALANLTPTDARPLMKNSQVNFPSEIAEVDATEDATYITIGKGHKGVSKGKLAAVRTGLVDAVIAGTTVVFEYQLEFTNDTNKGDSGSIMIRERDNRVVGLVFASGPTLANPLSEMKWNSGAKSNDNFPTFST